MSDPWLSVLMPVYNGSAYLERALAGVLAEGDAELSQIELVVVDNSSTDDTLDILERYSSRLPMRVLQQPHAPSWLTGTNRALHASSGRFLSILHHDDEWVRGRLNLLRRVTAGDTIDLVLHPVDFIGPTGNLLGRWSCPLPSGTYSGREVLLSLLVQNFIAVPAPVVRRSLAVNVGGFDDELWYTADWDFWMKAAARATNVRVLGDRLARYRIHPASQTSSKSSNQEEFRRQHRIPLERHLQSAAALGLDTALAERLGRLSIEVNVYLASRAHGARPSAKCLVGAIREAGVLGTVDYARRARLVERALARVRLSRSSRR